MATNKQTNARLNHLTRALNTVNGNVFAPEFRQFLKADNWKRPGERTFFKDITQVRCTSGFLVPRDDLVAYKDFLIPLFAICALWDPEVLRLMVLNDQKPTPEVSELQSYGFVTLNRVVMRTSSSGSCASAWR